MKILFEDSEIIVCVKPQGILSQTDSKGSNSMVTLLEEYCGITVFPLHRLDREVGGVMIYAKTKFSASVLSRDISEHNFKKEYIALVHGKPLENSGEMRDLLFKDSFKNKSFVVKRERKGVKEAVLEYEVVCSVFENTQEFSVVKVLLHTGRTHQIRVQFASRKMPLCGDKKYGARDDFKEIGLWSYSISFNHPKTRKRLTFWQEPQNIIAKYKK